MRPEAELGRAGGSRSRGRVMVKGACHARGSCLGLDGLVSMGSFQQACLLGLNLGSEPHRPIIGPCKWAVRG